MEEKLVKFLNEKFPPLEYSEGDSITDFNTAAIFRSGQRDIIKRMALILEQQTKQRR